MVSRKLPDFSEDVPLAQLLNTNKTETIKGHKKKLNKRENEEETQVTIKKQQKEVFNLQKRKRGMGEQEVGTGTNDKKSKDQKPIKKESSLAMKEYPSLSTEKVEPLESVDVSFETKKKKTHLRSSSERDGTSQHVSHCKTEETMIKETNEKKSDFQPYVTANSVHPNEEKASQVEENDEGSNENDEGDDYRWWEQTVEDDTIKWTTLSHNGVLFPPEYEPHRIPIIYKGKEIVLLPNAEEVATFFAQKLATEYVKKQQFRQNFWEDFQQYLSPDERKVVKDLDGIDFTPIYQHLEAQKNAKKALTSAEKKTIREAEQERIKKYTVAIVDGKEEKVGNFRVEPPGLFLGRGEHPLMGKVKKRIMPEDITINIGEESPVPECPVPGHDWGQIVHNNTVTWLAGWRDTITGNYKYVWLSAASKFKGQSDQQKYEKARKLKDHIDKIRKDYMQGLKSDSLEERQRSTALYLIDRLALRVGNEKDEDEADTVGCCSLRVEHISLQPPDNVEFDFLGKDSIRYVNTVKVDKLIFKNLKEFISNKEKSNEIFDKLTVQGLNDHLKTLMPGLSAKVFRTYNASITLDRLLNEKKFSNEDDSMKLTFYNQANKEVAILCNHQRSLPVTHEQQIQRMQTKLDEALEWLHELEKALKEAKHAKVEKVDVVQYVRPKPVFHSNMSQLEREAERKRVAELPREKKIRSMKVSNLPIQMEKAEQRVAKIRSDMEMKEDLKNVALGTSKINYLDPRITVAWCKKNDVPIEKIFAKTLLSKFTWSMQTSEEFRF
eukprot:jgi/Galph1/2819/GphlegSOOS_G1451.1